MAKLSPMMEQYLNVKKDYEDAILMFRLGDFYEMFYKDAQLASEELELTLTGKDCGEEKRAPMCGVPYHSSEAYIARLIQKGYKVAICDQVEDPKTSKGIVKREVTRVVTPGTVIEGAMLKDGENNFICSMFVSKENTGICFCDVSTGELYATELINENSQEAYQRKIENELICYNPKEILLMGDIKLFKGLSSFIRQKLSALVEVISDFDTDYDKCKNIISENLNGDDLKSLHIESKYSLLYAISELVLYLKKTQLKCAGKINSITLYKEKQFMGIDLNTRRNLEIVETMIGREKKGSLLWVIDKTKTSMGKRLIKSWLEKPLLNCKEIIMRQDSVEELKKEVVLRGIIRENLSKVFDIERIITRVIYKSVNAREIRTLAFGIKLLPELKKHLTKFNSCMLKKIFDDMDTLEDIYSLIDSAIEEEPPITLKEGGIIKKGYSKEVDYLKELVSNGKEIIAKLESEEREKTGIPKLKIGYNRVFGYYIEVRNTSKDKVPDRYVRKQTLASCERYITKELKELEGKIIGAKEKLMGLEYEIFSAVRDTISLHSERIKTTASAIARLDVLCSLAEVAALNNYCRPIVDTSEKIILKDSRHPVVEEIRNGTPFVSNDVNLDTDLNRVAIITGPNMSGKSTYMRQVALICIMAQIGSFVPASHARLGIVDNVFTRIGASDDLAAGQSTFMVEMTEVSHILKNATKNSLLVLDEIGRGTSTFDGMSIASAVLEYVADKNKLGAKTLFATHYHELTDMENKIEGVKNYNIAVKKRGDDITFLRRIVKGPADDSYGIEVAKLAGLPDDLIKRAKQILDDIESKNSIIDKSVNFDKSVKNDAKNVEITDSEKLILKKLKSVDINTLTPIESMNVLFELSGMIKDDEVC